MQFHHEYPWIVSSSDDQTVRCYQMRRKKWVLKIIFSICYRAGFGIGKHEVVFQFSPVTITTLCVFRLLWFRKLTYRKMILIATHWSPVSSEGRSYSVGFPWSGRFDSKFGFILAPLIGNFGKTVRVWDISGLKKKTLGSSDNPPSSSVCCSHPESSNGHDSRYFSSQTISTDLFGGNDTVVKYLLEGHDRGVNWASFHPSLPLIVSGLIRVCFKQRCSSLLWMCFRSWWQASEIVADEWHQGLWIGHVYLEVDW